MEFWKLSNKVSWSGETEEVRGFIYVVQIKMSLGNPNGILFSLIQM